MDLGPTTDQKWVEELFYTPVACEILADDGDLHNNMMLAQLRNGYIRQKDILNYEKTAGPSYSEAQLFFYENSLLIKL